MRHSIVLVAALASISCAYVRRTSPEPTVSDATLAQIYFSDGRDSQGESMLRDLMAHPTIFVSKDQATITLARYLMLKKPA